MSASESAIIRPAREADLPGILAIYNDAVLNTTASWTVYVGAGARGRGLGRALVQALFPLALDLGKSVMIGGIDASNAASLAMHTALGFRETGRMPGVGRKFGRTLDLVLMQKQLG
jgi:phosphinothricin acetyltransferase